MVAVVRHKLSGLSACFKNTSALFELVPDAVDLNVEKFGWSAHCESSVVSRPVPIFLFSGGRGEFVSELGDKALGRPRTGFSERTDRPPGDVVCNALKSVGVSFDASSVEHSFRYLFHPERTFAAWCALAAALVGV